MKLPHTYADLMERDEDDRWELIDGEPFDMSVAYSSTKHSRVSGNMLLHFSNYLKYRSEVVNLGPLDVRIFAEGKDDKDVTTVVQPDLTIIFDPNKIDDRGILGPPDLVVEISTLPTLKRDKNEKVRLYQTAGVREYWIVNLEVHTVEKFLFPEQDSVLYTLYDNNIIKVGIFEDLEIPLSAIFA